MPLENGEAFVISVTPVATGIAVPMTVFVALEALIVWGALHWSVLHRHEAVVMLAVGLVPALVVATRSWRWRSHKITVTTQRVVVDGGVMARYSTQVHLLDVVATHADQTFAERLRRRGVVILETNAGSITLGPVRHPAALRRLLDRTRRDDAASQGQTWDDWFNDPNAEPF